MSSLHLVPDHPHLEVWIADTEATGCLPSSLIGFLDFEEQKKSRQLQGPERRRFMIGRILLRKALSSLLGGDPREWRFATQDTGKPVVTNLPESFDADFNVSYSGSAVAVAVSSACRVGVDIEGMIRPVLDEAEQGNPLGAVFTVNELETLERMPAESRWRETLRMWTIKEAYAKLLGLGFHLDFLDFEVSPWPRHIRHQVAGATASVAHLETHELSLGKRTYHLALASRACGSKAPHAVIRVVDPVAG